MSGFCRYDVRFRYIRSQFRPSTLDSGRSTHNWTLDPGHSTLDSPDGSRRLTFDFRILKLPNNPNREAVAWCALAGGQPLIGTTEWGRESISRDFVTYYFLSRAVQLRQILHAAVNRLPVRREKQFVRYSTPLNSDWPTAIETLNPFGPAWLNAGLL